MKKTLLLALCVLLCAFSVAQQQIIAPKVTLTEGQGNGGRFLYLSDNTMDEIMSGGSWKAQQVEYLEGHSPIDVRVVDPLQLQSAYDYRVKIQSLADSADPSLISNNAHWILEVLDASGTVVDTYVSEHTIGEGVAEPIEGHGISISVKNHPYTLYPDGAQKMLAYPNLSYVNNAKYSQVDFLGAFISYSGSAEWLGGVQDVNDQSRNNWVRAGKHNLGFWDDNGAHPGVEIEYDKWSQEDFFVLYRKDGEDVRVFHDYYGQFGNVIGGTWAPYPLASPFDGGPQAKYVTPETNNGYEPTPAYYDIAFLSAVPRQPGYNPAMINLYSVDVVLTPDKSKWTRCVVLEACDDSTYSEGHALRHEPRRAPSVDKDGNPDGTGMGMGWFPGYAVNVETGERLNMMFSENSADVNNHGNDMLFNPTSDTAQWGGRHFIYVCGSTGSTCGIIYRNDNVQRNYNFNNQVCQSGSLSEGGTFTGSDGIQYPWFDGGAYDECQWIKEKFETFTNIADISDRTRMMRKMQLFNNVMWTSIPMAVQGHESEWMSNEATIRIRVARPFMFYSSAVGVGPENPQNNNAPVFAFNTRTMDETMLYPQYEVSANVNENIMDINNIEAALSPIGQHFFDNEFFANHYFVPKGGQIQTYFNQTLWLGGLDDSENLHLAAQRFGQSGFDFWPGPLSMVDASVDEQTTRLWNKCFKISRVEVLEFLSNWGTPGYEIPAHILNWPAHGDTTLGQAYDLAPYVDVDNDNHYDPTHGDYPSFLGDMAIFFVFNDNFENHTESGGEPIGLEVHGMAYAFDVPEDTALNNTLFFNYKLFNRSQNSLHNTYIGLWNDWDVGYAYDDYVGCDVQKGTVYGYNASLCDTNATIDPDEPTMQALTVLAGPYMEADGRDNEAYADTADCAAYFQNPLDKYAINGVNFGNGIVDDERLGLTGFLYHSNDESVVGDPQAANEYYNMLCSKWRDGSHTKYGGNAHQYNGGVGPDCYYMFPGNSDPCNFGTNGVEVDVTIPELDYGSTGWTEVAVGNAPSDRRGLAIIGPFNFEAGGMQEVDFCLTTFFGDAAHGLSKAENEDLLYVLQYIRENFTHGEYAQDFTPEVITLHEVICEGETYDLFGKPYTESGRYVHFRSNAPRTIVATAFLLYLSVIPDSGMVYDAVLPGHAYNANGFSIPASETQHAGIQIHQTQVTTESGCHKNVILILEVRNDVGVDSYVQSKNLEIYPNPAENYVCLKVGDESLLDGHEMVSVYDLTGHLVRSFRLTDTTMRMEVAELSAGLYIVKVANYIGKFVKK